MPSKQPWTILNQGRPGAIEVESGLVGASDHEKLAAVALPLLISRQRLQDNGGGRLPDGRPTPSVLIFHCNTRATRSLCLLIL